MTHSWQSSIGVAQQFGSYMALEVDYVNTRSRDEKSIQDNVNITFNPATGIPYPYSDVAHRAFPLYGVVGMIPHIGQSDYHGLQTNFTKRMSQRWQGSLTYTLAGLWDQDPPPVSGFTDGPVPGGAGSRRRTIAGGNRSAASAGLQRHLAGRSRLPGERDLFLRFRPAHAGRLRLRCARTPDHQHRSPAAGWHDHPARSLRRPADSPRRVAAAAARAAARPAAIDGFVEVFNLFNRANYGATTSPRPVRHTGSAIPSPNLSYAPRTLQLGFRFTLLIAFIPPGGTGDEERDLGLRCRGVSVLSMAAQQPAAPPGREPSWAFPAINQPLPAEERRQERARQHQVVHAGADRRSDEPARLVPRRARARAGDSCRRATGRRWPAAPAI